MGSRSGRAGDRDRLHLTGAAAPVHVGRRLQGRCARRNAAATRGLRARSQPLRRHGSVSPRTTRSRHRRSRSRRPRRHAGRLHRRARGSRAPSGSRRRVSTYALARGAVQSRHWGSADRSAHLPDAVGASSALAAISISTWSSQEGRRARRRRRAVRSSRRSGRATTRARLGGLTPDADSTRATRPRRSGEEARAHEHGGGHHAGAADGGLPGRPGVAAARARAGRRLVRLTGPHGVPVSTRAFQARRVGFDSPWGYRRAVSSTGRARGF